MSTGTALIDAQVIFKKAQLAPGMRVADLGCGRTGHFVFQASKAVGEMGIVYAVDIIKNILETLQSRSRSEHFLNVQTIWSDIERLGGTPIPPATVNVTLLINVLNLVTNKVAVLQEAARLTVSGGKVVVVDWLKQLGPLGPDSAHLVPSTMVIDAATHAGLVLVEQGALEENHYCLIFKKT